MTPNNAFTALTCSVVVVVTNEFNMASYFPEAGNLNGSNAVMCSNVAGPSSSGSEDLFDFGSSSRYRTFIISPTASATGRHLGFEHDYYSHTAFRGVLRHRAPSSYGARVKFGEHLRSVKVREAIAESIFSFLSALQTSQFHHNSIVHN